MKAPLIHLELVQKPPAVPDYEPLLRIGHGAYGDVWLARSTARGVLRAVEIKPARKSPIQGVAEKLSFLTIMPQRKR